MGAGTEGSWVLLLCGSHMLVLSLIPRLPSTQPGNEARFLS